MAKRRSDVSIHRPVVWVTGASRGIGREIAKQFASIGCEVALSARSKRDLYSVVKEITQLGGRAYSFPLDISKEESIFNIAGTIKKRLGNVEILVNNAGITVFKAFLQTTLKEFNGIIGTNLEGPIACIKAVLPAMARRKQGWIFNILSNAAIKTFEGSAAYTATKAGLLGLAKVLREEMRHYNVKVINVLPGPTETEMWSIRDRKNYAHRMMKAKSVAEAVLAAYQMPDDVVVDELVIRPIQGDIE
ncbi:MAG: SDR family oxidoreductase [Ignavibacteriae bacterium]|nr:SDR family oxidoreductase [Ignavibacteriota bacterium]